MCIAFKLEDDNNEGYGISVLYRNKLLRLKQTLSPSCLWKSFQFQTNPQKDPCLSRDSEFNKQWSTEKQCDAHSAVADTRLWESAKRKKMTSVQQWGSYQNKACDCSADTWKVEILQLPVQRSSAPVWTVHWTRGVWMNEHCLVYDNWLQTARFACVLSPIAVDKRQTATAVWSEYAEIYSRITTMTHDIVNHLTKYVTNYIGTPDWSCGFYCTLQANLLELALRVEVL